MYACMYVYLYSISTCMYVYIFVSVWMDVIARFEFLISTFRSIYEGFQQGC